MAKNNFNKDDEQMAHDWMERYKENAKSYPTITKAHDVLGRELVNHMLKNSVFKKFILEDNSHQNWLMHTIDNE